MAGIYIHVPFCRRACHYCDFHFTTNLKNTEPLVACILKEIEIQKGYLNGEPISTIYSEAATPSYFQHRILRTYLEEFKNIIPLENDARNNA